MKQERKKPIPEAEIAKALRCSASADRPKNCEECPYIMREMLEINGAVESYEDCDVDKMALDAAAILEMLPSGWVPTPQDVAETQ